MRVLLLNPDPSLALSSEAGALAEEGTGHYPPLGLLYLQAALQAAGPHQVEILDAAVAGGVGQALHAWPHHSPPELVGVTALTPNLSGVLLAIRSARRAFPGARVVVGGPHTDIFPEETADLPGVDYVLAGEAEHTLPLLVQGLEQGALDSRIPGLHTRSSRPADKAARRPSVENLDALPMPQRERLDMRRYRGVGGEKQVFATLITSRGCPHRCTFCSTPRGKVRMRSVQAIAEEMERCARLGVRHVYFLDDTFPTGGRRLHELCDELARRRDLGLVPAWSCRTAAAGLSRQVLEAMRRAGCRRIQIGVESSTDEGLRALGKNTTIDQVRRTFAAARGSGLTTMAYFMLGLPTEHKAADVRRTLRFAAELGPTYALFNVLTLYPGTALLEEATRRGLVPPGAWRRFALRPDHRFRPPVWDEHLSRQALFELQDEAYRAFYLRPAAIWRLLWSGGGLRGKARAGARLALGPLRKLWRDKR